MLGEEALAAVLRNTDGEIVVAKPHGWEGVSPSMYRPFPNAQSDRRHFLVQVIGSIFTRGLVAPR